MDDVLAAAFRRHYRQIYHYVRRGGSSHADTEEITQEVFAQAAASLERLSLGQPPLAAWLYTVARRRLVDEGRRRARAAKAAAQSPSPVEIVGPSYGPDVGESLR